MISKEITVNCPIGLLVKPAGIVCQQAVNYKSKITLEYEGGTANAKSMLSVLGASIKDADAVTIVCEGPDEQTALEEMTELLTKQLM